VGACAPNPPAREAQGVSQQEQHEITSALAALRRGAPAAMERLLPIVYGELRRMAHRQFGAEPAGHTLSTTALVHEAYIKLASQRRPPCEDRAQFFAVAARVMRRVLVDYARRHRAARRGGADRRPVDLDALELAESSELAVAERADSLLALDDALERLAALDEQMARVVECRFFAGLTEAETAEAIGVSQRTVAREWMRAKGWLYQEIRGDIS
jgi:RNA polymerase sigma factor (TIGR02999 family)